MEKINYFARPQSIADLCRCGNMARRDGKCWNCYWFYPPNPPLSDEARQGIVDRLRDLPELGSM